MKKQIKLLSWLGVEEEARSKPVGKSAAIWKVRKSCTGSMVGRRKEWSEQSAVVYQKVTGRYAVTPCAYALVDSDSGVSDDQLLARSSTSRRNAARLASSTRAAASRFVETQK